MASWVQACGFALLLALPGAAAQGNNLTSLPQLPSPEDTRAYIELFKDTIGDSLWGGFDTDKQCGDADPLVFFEETGCQQNTVGSLATAKGCIHNNIKDDFDCFDNDEADSVLILPWFPCGGTVTLCDDPSDCLEDDKITIALLKQ